MRKPAQCQRTTVQRSEILRLILREDFKKAFENHGIETEGHVIRLRECFALLHEHPQNTECRGMRRLVADKKAFREEDPVLGVVDAFNLGAGIKGETYEIRKYESLIDMAREMKYTQVARLLTQELGEERAALKKLTGFRKYGQSDSKENGRGRT
jgi:ferritin-like metal-binding protein YciE